MEQFRADLASWLVSLGAGKLSHEFFNLVNSIGSAKSKQEEALIIKKEAELLQQTINKPENLANEVDSPQKMMREFLIRGLYCEMLGHPVPFVYIHALNMTQSPRLLDKRVGYLCTASFLNDNHELLLLLLNSVRKDLDSTNILEVSAALSCMGWLLNRDTVYAILPMILEKCKSPNELVRKKAVILLLRCLQKDVAATWGDVENVLRSRLCDSDPSVMAATLHCFLYVLELKHSDPVTYASLPNLVDLVPSFVGILKQLVERRLPSHYNYHQVHGPWIQISLLRLLRYLGMSDPACITHMSQVLKLILTNPADRMAACAVVNEVIHTICSFSSPDKSLLDLCARNITLFLGATSQDLNYLGLKLLAKIVTINPIYATEHQAHVISCLESPDETIRTKTIELLFHMTNSKNLFVIVGKMLERLKKTTDIFMRTELVNKITTLAEKYSTDNFWFITTMNDVFLTAGDQVPTEVAYKFLRYIAEGATDDEDVNIDLRLHAVNAYMQLSDSPHLSDILQMVMAWVIGEYGYLIANPMEAVNALSDLLDRVPNIKTSNVSNTAFFTPGGSGALNGYGYMNIDSFSSYYGSDVKQWIVSALTKLAASVGMFPLHVREAFVKLSGSDHTELARRCQETLLLLDRAASVGGGFSSSPLISIDGTLATQQKNSGYGSSHGLLADIFPSDAAAEDLLPSAVLGASLDAYVKSALNAGARPYSRPVERTFLQTTTPKEEKALRWKAYERPTEVPRFNPNTHSPLGAGGIGALGTPQAPYNPLMTTSAAVSNAGASMASHPSQTQAPSTPASLASMATRTGPWSAGGFARSNPPSSPYATSAQTSPSSNISPVPTRPIESRMDVSNGPQTLHQPPNPTETYRPKLDANHARLANALFSGVGESPSASPTSTNIHHMARNRSSGQFSSSSNTRAATRSSSQTSLNQGNLIDIASDEARGTDRTATTASQNSTQDLLGLDFGTSATPLQSQLSSHSQQHVPSTSPLSTSHSLLGPDLMSTSPAGTAPSPSSSAVDLLGASIGSTSIGSSSSLNGSGYRGSPSISPSNSQQSVNDVMQFTDSSSSGGYNANGGQLKQLTIDKDNWNLSNMSHSHLISSYLESFPKPSQSVQMLNNDPFLGILVLKSWTRDGMNVGLFFGNRTSLKISNVSSIIQLSAPLSMHIEADNTVKVDAFQEKDCELAIKEISAHFAAAAVVCLRVDDKVSLNMSISGTTTFEVHNQPKSIKYRIPIDFRDVVRSLNVPVEQFGAAWNAPEMRQVVIRSPSGNYGTTNELATAVASLNFGIIQAGKAEIVAACNLCFDTTKPNSVPSTVCLLHMKLDAAAGTIDFTFKSESHSFAEIASRYFSSIFG